MTKYVAFLRGVNVGGHHKVPMGELSKALAKLGFENIITILNSGNVIFDAKNDDLNSIEKIVSESLEKTFGFSIPTLIRTSTEIQRLIMNSPFEEVDVNKDIRLYVSFIKVKTDIDLELPWTSPDHSYRIIERRDNSIFSILDLSIANTPQAMGLLEKLYGSDITTRNWKTLERIVNKI